MIDGVANDVHKSRSVARCVSPRARRRMGQNGVASDCEGSEGDQVAKRLSRLEDKVDYIMFKVDAMAGMLSNWQSLQFPVAFVPCHSSFHDNLHFS